MLVLSRKVGEKIFVGSDITVTIVRISGQNVRVGIDAPRKMPILREGVPLEEPERPRPSL